MSLIDKWAEYLVDATYKPELWDSLVINKRKPHTYRAYLFLPDGSRACFHRFSPCDVSEAFTHPHAWDAEFLVLKGSYEQYLFYTQTLHDEELCPVGGFKCITGTQYSISSPFIWHKVIPLETTWTLMINRIPWPNTHISVRTTAGKDLEKMGEVDLRDHLRECGVYLRLLKRINTLTSIQHALRTMNRNDDIIVTNDLNDKVKESFKQGK